MADVTMGDIGDHRMYHRAREADASLARAAANLLQLHALLDRTWFRERHGVRFELEGVGKGLSLLVLRQDAEIARWNARGETLVFVTRGGTELRAELIACAVSITCDFLDQKGRKN